MMTAATRCAALATLAAVALLPGAGAVASDVPATTPLEDTVAALASTVRHLEEKNEKLEDTMRSCSERSADALASIVRQQDKNGRLDESNEKLASSMRQLSQNNEKLEDTVRQLEEKNELLEARNNALELAVSALRRNGATVAPNGDVSSGRRLTTTTATRGVVRWSDDHFELEGGDVHATDGKFVDVDGVVNNGTVAFVANFTEVVEDASDGDQIVFPNVEVNEGGGYDGSTSTFTAPCAGLYRFDVSMEMNVYRTSGYGYVAFLFELNGGEAVASNLMYASGTSPLDEFGAGHTTMILAKGDSVTLKIGLDNLSQCTLGDFFVNTAGINWGEKPAFSGKRPHNTFSGFLISRL